MLHENWGGGCILSEEPDATHHSQQPEQLVTSRHFPESYNLRVECKENDPLNQLTAVVLLLQRDVADLTLILNMQY
jgi:hypothetical protein